MAATSSFVVKHCGHDGVFLPKYTRYQKAQKVKVLRCFPHCCPSHVYYRYCGAPIEVKTQLPTNDTSVDDYVTLLKIAPAYDVDWAVGEVIPRVTAADLKARANEHGTTWHVGRNELRAGGETAELTSSFNNDLVDGWVYGWKSGRSQVVRDCLHHVKVFIFAIERSKNDVHWRLVDRVFSPGFTFVSYRSLHYANASEPNETHRAASPVLSGNLPPSGIAPPSSPRHVSPQTQLMANRLGLLVLCVGQLPVIHGPWQTDLVEAVAGTRRGPPTPLPFRLVAGEPPSAARAMLMQWLVHLVHSQHAAMYRRVIAANHNCLFDKARLMTAYNACVHMLHAASEAFFEARGTTVGAVAKAVASADLEDALQAQVGTEGYFGYHSFVAHFREVFLSSTSGPVAWPTARVSPMCGNWIFDPSRSRLQLPPCTVLDAVRWATWLYRCRLALSNGTLLVQSHWGVYSSRPSMLELDRSPRILRVFPNGESTMAGHGHVLHGDYVAYEPTRGEVVIEYFGYDLLQHEGWRIVLHLVRGLDGCLVVRAAIHKLVAPMDDDIVCSSPESRVQLWATSPFDVVGHGDAVYVAAA
ncbi:hypothetical protein SPRG_16030 [Saprolegnia parasitica CBS 223.65]|uniref:Uncharacterized protein n=1 Tax=Saprolegnia parasitica (strain CBS 223.65) TaxID=695850 RepID=A0A067BWF4_SAPPC|nr:hypothetical protein SPRG_16030 [Saprolegnia parasitica CBS 223.65]KDO18611.1 hypothetical protein SPRG_16030 [Saprolegnia parasitica CBS 223.65]|eukprot:XP_012210679.1 hypothetical protein SPRG_16030 [Saprolegnia parasitica CBS 223.65]